MPPAKPPTRRFDVPAELRDALQGVQELIEEAQRNPDDLSIDFDDAIQIGPIVGGAVDVALSVFQLTYRGGGGVRWMLRLTDSDIEDLASGWLDSLSLYVCGDPACGEAATRAELLRCGHAPRGSGVA